MGEVEANKSAISDHNRIEVNKNYIIKEEKLQQNYQKIDNTMRSLNFHAEEKINWDLIIKHIKDMSWKNICECGVAIEVIELLLSKCNEICLENVSKRNKVRKKKGIPKEIKKFINRIKML